MFGRTKARRIDTVLSVSGVGRAESSVVLNREGKSGRKAGRKEGQWPEWSGA